METTTPVQEDRNPFAKVAATICLAAPVFAIGLNYLFSVASKSLAGQITAQNLRLAVLGVAGVSCMLMLVGLIMGIFALLLMKSGHRKQVIFQTLSGMAITGLLCAIAVPNFVRARETALANKKAYASLNAAATELKNDTVASIKNSDGNGPQLDRFQKQLNAAASTATGEEALLFKASQAFTARIVALQKNYQQAADELNAASVLSTSNLVDRSAIKERRAIVQKFLKSNAEMKNCLLQDEMIFRQELTRLNVRPVEIESAMRGFITTSRPRSKIILEIREDDDRMGQAMLGTLDVLDGEWGHWSYRQTAPRLVFESHAALEQYNAFQHQIKDARADQAASQDKLVALLQQSPAQKAH